jgi:hypothetical protein
MVLSIPIAGPSTQPPRNGQHRLVTSSMVKRRRRPQKSSNFHLPIAPPLLVLPGRKRLTQQSPNIAGRSQQQQPLGDAGSADQHDTPSAGDLLEHQEEGSSFYNSLHYISDGDLLTPSRSNNRQKKINQWRRWTNEVIPSLIAPYLAYLRKSTSLRNRIELQPDEAAAFQCRSSCRRRALEITCILFNRMSLLLPRLLVDL